MKYPDIKTYETLYRRFLQNDRSNEMLDTAGDLTGKVFLDICCGGGRLTQTAIDRKPKSCIMIDSALSMIPENFGHDGVTDVIIMTVESAFKHMRQKNIMVDVAICQQGVNYWLTESKAWNLSLLIPEGGVFVFNTFSKRPSEIPKIRQYTCQNPYEVEKRHYTEVSWSVGIDIHHVQVCQGMEPHFTTFKWMDEEYVRTCLEKFFDVELIIDNKTSIYKCVKK